MSKDERKKKIVLKEGYRMKKCSSCGEHYPATMDCCPFCHKK